MVPVIASSFIRNVFYKIEPLDKVNVRAFVTFFFLIQQNNRLGCYGFYRMLVFYSAQLNNFDIGLKLLDHMKKLRNRISVVFIDYSLILMSMKNVREHYKRFSVHQNKLFEIPIKTRDWYKRII